jgi:hypothetical protein
MPPEQQVIGFLTAELGVDVVQAGGAVHWIDGPGLVTVAESFQRAGFDVEVNTRHLDLMVRVNPHYRVVTSRALRARTVLLAVFRTLRTGTLPWVTELSTPAVSDRERERLFLSTAFPTSGYRPTGLEEEIALTLLRDQFPAIEWFCRTTCGPCWLWYTSWAAWSSR